MAARTLLEAQKAHGRAIYGTSGYACDIGDLFRYFRADQLSGFIAEVRRRVDRNMWHGFVASTPLGSLMDQEERRKFEDSLKQQDVPEATPDNVFATMNRLRGEAGVIFRRGLVNVFRRLSRDYQSHDGFKLGARLVMTHVTNGGSTFTRFTQWGEEKLRDLDRVFHVLDGNAAPEYQQGLCAAMRTAFHEKKSEAETDYFRVRWFQNGNAHLWLKRDDLAERANKLIAEHFGETLGVRPKRDQRAS